MQVVQVQPGPTIQLNIRIDSPPQTMNSLKLSQAQILTTSKYAITILRILILTKCYKTVMLELLGVVPSGCDSIQGTVYLQPLSVSWVASLQSSTASHLGEFHQKPAVKTVSQGLFGNTFVRPDYIVMFHGWVINGDEIL